MGKNPSVAEANACLIKHATVILTSPLQGQGEMGMKISDLV